MSELKYLLRKKSDNSVLINRENVSADLLQKNLSSLANSKYWHAFIIHDVKKPNKNEILKIVLDYIFPLDLIPGHFESIGTACMFLARNCADAILKLCKDGLLIPHPTKVTNLYPCEIVLQYATIATLKHDVQKNVSTVLKTLFNEDTKTLDLEGFSNNPELTEYSPLSQPKIFYFVLHLSKDFNPTCIKLNNNEIRSLFPLAALSGVTAVKELDLRNNLISNISELESLKVLEIVELWLDGNPLCEDYEEQTYISKIREILPLLEKLDGIMLKQKGEIIIEKNYLCSKDGFELVSQFMEHFFTLYDSDRKLLEELYHPVALFSVTSVFKKGLVTSGTAKLDVYEDLSRNLMSVSNLNKNWEMLSRGNAEIVNKLKGLPETIHDAYSFCVDLIHYTNTLAVISITGTFREVPEGPLEPERLLGFNRIFVIGCSGDRYFIYNDLLHVYNALDHQVTRAFTQGEGIKFTLVANSLKEKDKAEEAIRLITGINGEWSKRLLEDAGYNLPRFLKTLIELVKSDKIPEEAYKISKGKDKEAFLKWMVTQALQFGVHYFKNPLRTEILEYLAEHPSLLLNSDVNYSEPLEANSPELEKDPNDLEEELWLQKYENLTLNVEKKQSEFEKNNSTKIVSPNLTNSRMNTSTNQTPPNDPNVVPSSVSMDVSKEKSICPRQPLTTYDCVPMELSDDDDENNKVPDVNQTTGSAALPLLYRPEEIHDQINHHQTPHAEMLVHYGVNNLHLEQNQTVSPSMFVPYEHVSFNMQHPPNPNLLIMGDNMQPPLDLNMVPPVAPSNVFIPPLPQEENVQQPVKHSDKIEEILRLEELKRKKDIQINLLFNKFKAQQAARLANAPVVQPLGFGRAIIPSVPIAHNMNNNPTTMAPIVDSVKMVPPLPVVSTVPISYGPVTPSINETRNINTNTDPKKSWVEKNTRTNLIDVSKIGKNKGKDAIENQKFETEVSQDDKNAVTSDTEKTVDEGPPRIEVKNSSDASEIISYAPRTPSIILTNDDTIPARVYAAKKISDKEQKQLNWKPPTITLLNGEWTYIEQNEERAFRLIYNKWILMQKDNFGKWQQLQDDFVKNYSCWKKHFPSYNNEILQHVLSASCLKSFVKNTFDSIPDPVTYWDFPASVPHDLRPPQEKDLVLGENAYKISVTPGSGFGFISVNGKWVLLAKNEQNQWVIMRKKGKYIAWLDGKWTCHNAFPRIVPPTTREPEKQYMPTLGLFSKKWLVLPTTTMTLKLLFGYWVIFRKNNYGRWNVARDDFANAFTCKMKHFPGDRESVPNPKQGSWKQPPNFHAPKLSCLPSFDFRIFDAIGFPVTSYHFSPTVPADLRPPKRYLILDREIRRYVEKDITPDSNFGFVSVNGKWEIREKTEEGTWIPVETKCPDTQVSNPKNTDEIAVSDKNLVNTSKIRPVRDNSSKKFDGSTTSITGSPKSQEIHHEEESPMKPGGETTSSEDKLKDNAKNVSFATNTNKIKSKTRWGSSTKDHVAMKSQEQNAVDTPKKVDGAAITPGGKPQSVDDTPKVSLLETNKIISKQKDIEVTPSSKAEKEKLDIRPGEENIKSKSSISASPNLLDVNDAALNKNVSSNKLLSTNQILKETKIVSSEDKVISAGDASPSTKNLNRKTEVVAEQQVEPLSLESREIACEGDKKFSSASTEVQSMKIDEKKGSGDARASIRLNTLNMWKKTFQLIPSIPKLTLLNGEWNIISEHPHLEFHQFALGNWQLLKLNSDGQWTPLKDDFILAKEKSKNPNNLKEYMSFIGNQKYDSIAIPVTHSDFPSSVPNKLRPPQVMEYRNEIIQISPNSGYACLSIGGKWILLKQDDDGNWKPLDDKFHIAVKEKFKNTPESYLTNSVSNTKKRNIVQKLSTAVCSFVELITGDIPDTIVKPITHWDIDGPEDERPPKFALTEVDGKKQWSGIRPNSGLGFVLEDNVWVLMKQTEFNEWNEYKISSYDGCMLGYFLMNNRWMTMKKYIFGGKWEPLFDYKSTPTTYWDFIGPEEEKPPRNVFFSSQKKLKNIHKNSGMGFLKRDDTWILFEDKNDKWSVVKDGEREYTFKLIDGMWEAVEKHPDGNWIPIPVLCPKIVTFWNFNGLPAYAPPRRIVFEENGTKSSKIINVDSGMGFLLDDGIWILVKEGENGEPIHVKNSDKETAEIGFEARNGKFKIMRKDEKGNWIRSENISKIPTSTSKCLYTAEKISFDDKFRNPIPLTYYDIPSDIPEHLKPPRYGLLPSFNSDIKWECIRSNSGFGFIFENGMWKLMKWVFGRGWLFLDGLVAINTTSYKAIDGRWVPMKKEDEKWLPLFDPFSTPRVIGQCFGSSENKPPFRVPIDGTNIVDVTFETKMGFLKESCVWILMKQQEDDTWKRFEYSEDSEGWYGYKRVQNDFVLVKKTEYGNWSRVCWDWNTNMWNSSESLREIYDNEETPSNEKWENHESLTTQVAPYKIKDHINKKCTSKSYIAKPPFTNRMPANIESGASGYLKCIRITRNGTISFIKIEGIWVMVAQDMNGWFIPNDCQGYKLIDHKWAVMRKDVTGSWLPKFDPTTTPKSFWNTSFGNRAPKRVAIYTEGITTWMDTSYDLNLGFIKDGKAWIMVERRDGDWEVMTDDLEESSLLAFKLIDYRWNRVKQNVFGEWIPCSKQITLPVLHTDVIGPKKASPPQHFHLMSKEGHLDYFDSSCFANLGFEKEDGAWVLMKCHEDYTWSRHPDVYNDEGVYGYKYMNGEYILLLKKKNGKWKNVKKKNGRYIIGNYSPRQQEGREKLKGRDDVVIDVQINENNEVKKLKDNDIPTTSAAEENILLNSSDIIISYYDTSVLPEYLKPPSYITVMKNGMPKYVKVDKLCGRAFIKRHNAWIYVERKDNQWFIVNDKEGYKLIDNRWVLMIKKPDGSWLPAFDPILTPRTALDTVGIKNQPPRRVVVCENGCLKWMNTSHDTSFGFIRENDAWIFMKRGGNGEWTEENDELEGEPRMCFKLIDYKWQRVKKNEIGEWIPCIKQFSLPITHFDVVGPPEATPPCSIGTVMGKSKRLRIRLNNSHIGFIEKDGVWILMHLENLCWSEYKIVADDNTYGYKRISGKWILMKRSNDKWITVVKTNNTGELPESDEPPKINKQLSFLEMELEELNTKRAPSIFKKLIRLPAYQRPPESLPLEVDGTLRRVWFRYETQYKFQNQDGVWILLEEDSKGFKIVQYADNQLLGYKLIDNRWVIMKKLSKNNWVNTFDPVSTPRTYLDTVGSKFKRPPVRIAWNEKGVNRWKIVSEENGLGFLKEKDMWILMQKQSDSSWTKFREGPKEEEFGFKIHDRTWAKFKRCLNGFWKYCAPLDLPLLFCDFPVYYENSPPQKLFYTSPTLEINFKPFIDDDPDSGFQLVDGAWVFMKCDEKGTWSKVDLFPEQRGTFGYVRKEEWQVVKKDDNNKWKVVSTKIGPKGRLSLDFDDKVKSITESDQPLAKKRRVEPTLTEIEAATTSSALRESEGSSSPTEIEDEASVNTKITEPASLNTPITEPNSFNTSLTEPVKENYAALKLEKLISSQTPMPWKKCCSDRIGKPPNNIVVNVNGTPKRISLNKIGIAFLIDDGVWVAIKKDKGSWNTVHSDIDGLLGYKLIDARWVIMKKERETGWVPTFDPILTPRNHFDTVGPLDKKPPVRVVVNENGIDKWKVAAEENGFGFIKHEDVWVLMSKVEGSWMKYADSSDQEIGYRIVNYKWTKIKKTKDGTWQPLSKCLPCLHWDYVCRDKTIIPPNIFPIQYSSSKKTRCEIIRVDSGKGFEMEDGVWFPKQSKADGTWENIDLFPGYKDPVGIMRSQDWNIVKKGIHGEWVKICTLDTLDSSKNAQADPDTGTQSESISSEHQCVQPEVTKNICVTIPTVELLNDASPKQIHIDAQLSDQSQTEARLTSSKKDISIEPTVIYHQFRNAPYQKRPPQSVLINIDGILKRILLTQKNTNMGFQKQGDNIWMLMQQQDKSWKPFQNSSEGFLGFKLVNNRWVIMRKGKENEWTPSFDPTTTPRSFFDTVGRRDTRPPIRAVINKNGVYRWQIISEEYGFGFTKREEMWVLMKKQTDESWVEFQDDWNREILGYNLMKFKWTMFKRNDNGVWSCCSEVALPVLHWDYVNGDQVAPPQSMCDCCEARDMKDIKACLGPESGKGFQFEDGAWVPMKCAEDGSWSKFDLFPGQQGTFGYMNIEGWKIVKRDTDDRWRFVKKNDQGMWIFHDLKKNKIEKKSETDVKNPQDFEKKIPFLMDCKSNSSKDGYFAPTHDWQPSPEDKLTENILFSKHTSYQVPPFDNGSSLKVTKKQCELNENSDLSTSLALLKSTDCDFPLKEKKISSVESSKISLGTNETIKIDEESGKKSSFFTFEHSDLDDLLPPLTPNYLRTLPKVAAETVFFESDENTPSCSANTSTNLKRKLDFEKEDSPNHKPSLNSVELYLAANPSYELSCPELQNLLRQFRPSDKPNKLIRKRFKLPDGNTVLLTIPKGLPETFNQNQESNRRKLNVVEEYLATHLPSDWDSSELKEILCEFKANDLKVSKRPCRYEFLFPDGERRALSIPRRADEKNNASNVLATEIRNILKNYKKRSAEKVGTKRKLIEDIIEIEKVNKSPKTIEEKKLAEGETEKEYIQRKRKFRKPGPKSKT